MTRTFNTKFPSYHPKAGLPTQFVEKIWLSLIDCGIISMSRACELSREAGIGGFDMHNIRKCDLTPKHHTIRAGHHIKPGNIISPRIWGNNINPTSGRSGPYHSKQITFAPDIEIVKTWNFDITQSKTNGIITTCTLGNKKILGVFEEMEIAKNDGLAYEDFCSWFLLSKEFRKSKQFSGQIICWNEAINY